MTSTQSGVTFVVPVRNGAALICETIQAIDTQRTSRPFEIVVVDDGSVDGSVEAIEAVATIHPLRVVRRQGGGAAAAINAGIGFARYPLIAQVDQDVRLDPLWLEALAAEAEAPGVAAAQGYYATDPRSSLWMRVMGLDLEQRYIALGRDTDHVCTGNSVYRTDALRQVGLFDESLGYGYDNDMSYRLSAAAYKLRLCPPARSVHVWRDGFAGYLRQQYGFGYGRLDLIAKHPSRLTGDAVSPPAMMMHPLVLAASLAALASNRPALAATLVSLLAIERLSAGISAARRFHDRAALLFPVVHLLRDAAWAAAIGVWLFRRLITRTPKPSFSMRPRTPSNPKPRIPNPTRFVTPPTIALIPAHNEATNLEAVVADLNICRPDIDVVVIDDGSTDATSSVLERLNVGRIHFDERMGVGSAIRAGLQYAVRLGYQAAVRVDGDGQHGAADIDRLLAPVLSGEADVVQGTRYAPGDTRSRGKPGPLRLALATCLTALTGRQVTDPTSGFCAFGPRAMRLLAEHHPGGYAEPELRLFLSRNGLRVSEVPVDARPRMGGTTSLTPSRIVGATARLALAMLIVPFRAAVTEPVGD